MIGKKEISALLQGHPPEQFHVEQYLERNGRVYLCSREMKMRWRVSKRIFSQFNLKFEGRPFLNMQTFKFTKALTAI